MAATSKPAKLFSVEEANAMLPLVGAIVSDLVRHSQQLVDRRQRLSHLMQGRQLEEGDPYSDELAQIEYELEGQGRRIASYAAELEELGVELKDPLTGLVDFPHQHEGRLVYLCWQHGEDEVAFWHELDAGFSGRQPLVAAAANED